MTMVGAAARSNPRDPFAELSAIATEIGAAEIAGDVHALASRVAEGLFYVACVGQFKRGKSTVLNALIGCPLLPTGVVPVTAVITIVRFGPAERAIVHFEGGRQEAVDPATIADYVAEERNPENRKGVRVVEAFAPSEILASGMCLVDTPGLGSIFQQNSETTRAFVPHVDAALVVLGADPPISGEEAAIAEEIGREAPHMLFVLNKADRMSARDVAEAAAFTRTALRLRLGREIALFTISALERTEGSVTREWAALEVALTALARDAGVDLVRGAQERGHRRLAARLFREIAGQSDALTRPIADSEARVADLRQTIDDARRALGDLAYLFAAEQHRLSREFEEEREGFLKNALPAASTELDDAITADQRRGGALREESFQAAERIAQDAVRGWLEQIEPRAEELYARATDRFVALAQEFLRRVETSDAGDDAEDIGAGQRFRKRRGFYFTGLWALTSRPPGAGAIDVFRTANQRRERARRDAQAFLRRLLESNSARVANDLTDRVLESRRQLEAEVRDILDRATTSAGRALERARAAQERGADGVVRALAGLDDARRRLQEIAPP
jgi:hypothetical protein